MHSGQLVFAKVMAYLPLKAFSRMVTARRAQHKVQDFSCLDQFLVLAFAQLTARESLRDIEINLRAQRKISTMWGCVARRFLAIRWPTPIASDRGRFLQIWPIT